MSDADTFDPAELDATFPVVELVGCSICDREIPVDRAVAVEVEAPSRFGPGCIEWLCTRCAANVAEREAMFRAAGRY